VFTIIIALTNLNKPMYTKYLKLGLFLDTVMILVAVCIMTLSESGM
jgi:hypothetical protein